jgi:hypothetical protein
MLTRQLNLDTSIESMANLVTSPHEARRSSGEVLICAVSSERLWYAIHFDMIRDDAKY